MATADVVRGKKRADSASPPKRKSRAFRYGSLVTLVILLTLGYTAPWVASHTPLGPAVLGSVLKINGTVSIGSLSLDWFSGVDVEDLEIRDPEGNLALQIGTLRTDKPLIGLLMDLADLGQVHVERVTIQVTALEDQTNLERIFAALLNKSDLTQPSIVLTIADSKIFVDDVPAKRQFRVEKLAAAFTFSDLDESLVCTASGELIDAQRPGSFKVEVHTGGSARNGTALAAGKLDCQAEALPLELIDPLLRRWIDGATLSGHLTTRLAGAWGEMAAGQEATVSGDTVLSGLVFSCRALTTEAIRVERVEIPCKLAQNGDKIEIQQLGAQCELGTLNISGSAKLSDLSAADVLGALVREEYEVDGRLDLAPLGQMLNKTLRLRPGTELTSGQVALAINSKRQESGMGWTGHVDASHLGARANGRVLAWENPLAVDFSVHEAVAGWVLDQARCTSSFLQVEAAGSIDDLAAKASFDLAQLMSELRQFSDLDQLQLAGQATAELDWKRPAADQFTAEATFSAHGFQVAAAGLRPLTEDTLAGRLDLSGQLADQAVKRIDHAQLILEAGGERLQADLQEPLAAPFEAACAVRCSWRGQLAHWAPRLEAALGITGWTLDGAGTLEADLKCSPKAIDIAFAQADFSQLAAAGNDWFISEPTATSSLVGRFDLAQNRLEVAQAKLSAGSSTATIKQAVFARAASGWAVDGVKADVESDLAHLYRWRHDPRLPAAWQVTGKLSGQAELKYAAGVTTAQFDGNIDQMQVVDLASAVQNRAAEAAWSEPRVTLAASGSYQTADGRWQIDKMQLAAAALRVDASGSLHPSPPGGDVNLQGTIGYDWEQLAPLWRPYVGQGIAVAGRQSRPFTLAGHLSGLATNPDSWRALSGEASLGWTSMNVEGMAVGPGEVALQLAAGRVQAKPLDIEVSEGRMTVAPAVQVSPAPATLLLAGGPLLTNVHLSPDVCARGLKFIAPVLSQSTVADGYFSIALDGGRIPLGNLATGDVSGRMGIKAQVKPGPVAQQFMILLTEIATILRQGVPASLGDQSGALVSIDDANVEFRMVQGRVYHRGLTFTVGTTPITTHGSVGLDESLAIVAEVPIRATFFGRDLSLGLLEGQTLQIPIEGTLAKPKLELHVLDQLTGKALQNVGRGAIVNELNKTLEKLIPGQP